MDPKLKQLWIDDLRAGHPQTQERLKDRTGHCCLGRLCEVMAANNLVPDGFELEIRANQIRVNGETVELGEYFREAIGLTEKQQRDCIVMNDGEGSSRQRTFPEIADWIEANL